MRGHLYCTEKCARDAGRHAVWRRVRGVLSTPVPARLAVAAVLLAAAAPVLLALKTVRELDRVPLPTGLARGSRGVAAARLETLVETPAGLRLEGTAADGGAVFLFSGTRFLAAAPVENGRFLFEGIREKGPFRVGAMPLSAPIAYAPPTAAPTAPKVAVARPTATLSPPHITIVAAPRLAVLAVPTPALPPAPQPSVPSGARPRAAELAPAIPTPLGAPRGPAAPDLTRG
ncbi:MAG TPA: hypothetical protein VMH79_04765, partial [Thermoanaerobaculia bacterium]|nr:hypothetical protein [Thermoanaerobaculia bacterium]